jgi:hypothetical protein
MAVKKGAITAGEKGPAVWLRDGLLQRVEKPNLNTRPAPHTWRGCRTATLVALGQLHHLPVARENCGSECDHQIMISEMLIEVKGNLSELLRRVLRDSASGKL